MTAVTQPGDLRHVIWILAGVASKENCDRFFRLLLCSNGARTARNENHKLKLGAKVCESCLLILL